MLCADFPSGEISARPSRVRHSSQSPRGDHCTTELLTVVRSIGALPPLARDFARTRPPGRVETNASQFPSGDQVGESCRMAPGSGAAGTGGPPSTFEIQIENES